jgi:hypothetical protein
MEDLTGDDDRGSWLGPLVGAGFLIAAVALFTSTFIEPFGFNAPGLGETLGFAGQAANAATASLVLLGVLAVWTSASLFGLSPGGQARMATITLVSALAAAAVIVGLAVYEVVYIVGLQVHFPPPATSAPTVSFASQYGPTITKVARSLQSLAGAVLGLVSAGTALYVLRSMVILRRDPRADGGAAQPQDTG